MKSQKWSKYPDCALSEARREACISPLLEKSWGFDIAWRSIRFSAVIANAVARLNPGHLLRGVRSFAAQSGYFDHHRENVRPLRGKREKDMQRKLNR